MIPRDIASLTQGNLYPYDSAAGESKDWAHMAVRGIMADMTDRRGIKHELEQLDEDIRNEMVEELSQIVRRAYQWRELDLIK